MPPAVDDAGMAKVLLVVAVAAVWFATGHERGVSEERLATISSELAARPVSVHCQSFGAELVDVTSEAGTVEFDQRGRPADVTKLKRKVCRALDRMRGDIGKPELACVESGNRCPARIHDEVWAATVLAHESMHLAGEIREDIAECEAMQKTALVAQRLGAGKKLARSVAAYAWKYVYPEAREDYRMLDCFNGGPFDLRPGDPHWP